MLTFFKKNSKVVFFPFNADNLRQTSFAKVEVTPILDITSDFKIPESDIEFSAYRSGGHGGQSVQKVSSAVRITHIPTGTIAVCQNERSQHQNKELAMKVLRARLVELEMQKHAEEQARLKGEHVAAGWGNQIRSYVLHPYKMVKDHRTDYETSDPNSVLDGGIDEFIQAYLKQSIGGQR